MKRLYSLLCALTLSVLIMSGAAPLVHARESIYKGSVSKNDIINLSGNDIINNSIINNSIPAYSGEAFADVNGGIPYFTAAEKKKTNAFENYSRLDKLDRCGVAYVNICKELIPKEERGAIGMVRPSGWHTIKYNDLIEGNYLYNRCHLVAFQLAGENANERNLITGTRYLNVEGMLPFENKVADYVNKTGNHVLYRVTPDFVGDNLVAGGVQIEAWSVEDSGKGICFNVYCYNVQPGITIDYATGESERSREDKSSSAALRAGRAKSNDSSNSSSAMSDASQAGKIKLNDFALASTVVSASQAGQAKSVAAAPTQPKKETADVSYVANKNTKKFHYPSCDSVSDMKEKNKLPFTGSRDQLISQGYVPCKRCNP